MAGRFAGAWDELRHGFDKAYGEGREDQIQVHHRERTDRGENIEAPRGEKLFGTNRTLTFLRDLTKTSNPEARAARENMGMGLEPTVMGKIGQGGGVLAGDLTQDRSREAWWLLNAPQAVVNVLQEIGLHNKTIGSPELWGTSPVMLPAHKKIKGKDVVDVPERALTTDIEDLDDAKRLGVVDKDGRTKKGISVKDNEYRSRDYEPGWVDSLMIPSGIATNAGIGLLNPVGGSEGYDAVFASEEDPNKTDNVVAEVAAKYILGRTGNLSKWSEFSEARPDVSKGEYNAYKAFKWDKNNDFDLRDGDFTVGTGVLKGTTDGIHGAELQFLGRSLPVNTALMPILSTMAGTIAGTKMGYGPGKRRIVGGLMGGVTGLASSSLAGNLVEQERRRRNMENNGKEDPMYSN